LRVKTLWAWSLALKVVEVFVVIKGKVVALQRWERDGKAISHYQSNCNVTGGLVKLDINFALDKWPWLKPLEQRRYSKHD